MIWAVIPLVGVAPGQLREREGRVVLESNATVLALPRGKAVAVGSGNWQLVAGGPAGRTIITVFGKALRAGKPPRWFPYDSQLALPVSLLPKASPAVIRVLGSDGVEVEAVEAGSVTFQLGGQSHTLRVRRLPGATEEEAELEIYFRDGSNGSGGSYPAGRFVALLPLPGGRYLLDFNRARNPFCAYNSVYPCPVPWPGNGLSVTLRAGERYDGGGLTPQP